MNRKRLSLGIVGLIIGVVFLTACCAPPPPATPISTWTPLPSIQPRPDFIEWVTPEESSHVAQALYEYEDEEIHWVGRPDPELGYASTVCVGPDLDHLVEKGDVFEDSNDVLERIELEVDGIIREAVGGLDGLVLVQKIVDDEVFAEWGGPYAFCWLAPVKVGIHVVSFRFRQTSGVIREYKWQFATTATAPPQAQAPTATPVDTPAPLTAVFPLPTPGPQPDFIFKIVPQPATSIPIEEFNNQVCVGIDRKLLFGDSTYDHEYFSEHLSITLNGTPIEGAQSPASGGAVQPLVSEETRITVGEEGPFPLTRCWLRVELEPGMYEMAIEFEKPSGQVVGYHYFFAITQE